MISVIDIWIFVMIISTQITKKYPAGREMRQFRNGQFRISSERLNCESNATPCLAKRPIAKKKVEECENFSFSMPYISQNLLHVISYISFDLHHRWPKFCIINHKIISSISKPFPSDFHLNYIRDDKTFSECWADCDKASPLQEK